VNSTIFTTIAVVVIFLIIWVLTVVAVWGAAGARRLPRVERLFWAALAVALPLVGALIYFFARVFGFITAVPRADASIRTGGTDPQIGASSVFGPAPRLFPTAGTQPSAPAPGPARAGGYGRLVVAQGPDAGLAINLTILPLRIGRGEGAHLPLEGDRLVSRQHAEIFERGGALHLRDLNSLHGTRLNGKPVREARLAAGDTIQIGDSVIIAELAA